MLFDWEPEDIDRMSLFLSLRVVITEKGTFESSAIYLTLRIFVRLFLTLADYR